MQKVSIYHAVGEPFFCPFCGVCTNPKYVEGQNAELKECQHLLYLGTTEGGFEYINPKYESVASEEINEDELIDLNIEDGIHFSLCDLPPSAFGVFIGYKS